MNQTNQTRQAIILGALLHDIGKFSQRAQEKPTIQDHTHWGEEWFQDNLAEKLTPVFNENEKQVIRSAIGNHHEYEQYISLADAISAGIDRIPLEDEEKGDPFTDRLISIFSGISISDNHRKDNKYHRIVPLGKELLKETLPIDDKKCLGREYLELLMAFNQEIKSSDFVYLSSEQVIDYIYSLLWKYTWCIPSAAYRHEPNISLFDHLKTTAAITGCLYDYHREQSDETLNTGSKAFRLVGGDISGIQSYIFDVLTQQGKVTKRLRARSLFVQLISEIAAHKILHIFDLPLCNLLISAGGNFYVLVPNLKETKKRIEELQKEFDGWTLSRLSAELSVSLATTKSSGEDLTNFPKALDRLKTNLNCRKYQPHSLVLTSGGIWSKEEFLRSEIITGDEKACQGCHKHPQKEIEGNEDNLCERCLTDTKIGQLLPKKKYLAFFNSSKQGFEILNYSFELWDDKDLKDKQTKKPYLILTLNDTQIELPVLGFKYLTTHIPTTADIPQADLEENQPVTFTEIANASKGDKLLGYVKADVDNLGKILREGFKEIKPSISGFATLSRMLETFFAGYLQVKLEKDFKKMYTIFSGGDDFFVVGPWNIAVEFVKEMRKEFTLFSAGNPDLTFSSGTILSRPHEPISFCARRVEAELKDSKQQKVKDKITVFNHTVSWVELDKILSEAHKVIRWLRKEPPIISRAFTYKLRSYGEMSRRYKEERKINYLKYVPLLTYDISRNLTKEEQKEAYIWAEDLRPSRDKPKGGDNLAYLETIMEFVLTYTRS